MAIFDRLFAERGAIERDYGAELSWQRLEGRRACRISTAMVPGGYCSPEAEWPTIQDAVIGSMQRLHKALEPHVKNPALRAGSQAAAAIAG